MIEAIVATGTHEGNQLFIPRIVLTPSDNLCPFTMHRKQFPIRPAFKSQGQTLKRVMIYLPKRMFCHGQLYVAMSRVGEYAEVKLCVADESFFAGFPICDNVYPEISLPSAHFSIITLVICSHCLLPQSSCFSVHPIILNRFNLPEGQTGSLVTIIVISLKRFVLHQVYGNKFLSNLTISTICRSICSNA